jgi:NADH-quinone oxidoreductase subunit M
VGVLYERTHDRAFAKMGGLAGKTPLYATALGFFMLASLGLPGLSGFVGEFLVLLGTFAVSPIAAAVAAVVMILGAAYLMYMFQQVVFAEMSDFLKGLGDHLTDMTAVEVATVAPLAVAVVAFGLFPGPILDLLQAPVTGILDHVAGAQALHLVLWR